MFKGAAAIRQSLVLLGKKASRSGRGKICVVICGGSALNLAGLIDRTTEDVDALGVESDAWEIEPLPEWLLDCAGEVAEELGLEEGWFNDAASVLKYFGFPTGMMKRANRETFGEGLQVAIVSRVDLIAMKSLAALDPRSGHWFQISGFVKLVGPTGFEPATS